MRAVFLALILAGCASASRTPAELFVRDWPLLSSPQEFPGVYDDTPNRGWSYSKRPSSAVFATHGQCDRARLMMKMFMDYARAVTLETVKKTNLHVSSFIEVFLQQTVGECAPILATDD